MFIRHRKNILINISFFFNKENIVPLYRLCGLSSAYNRKYRALQFLSSSWYFPIFRKKFFFYWLFERYPKYIWISFNFNLSKKWQLCAKERWCHAHI